MIASSILVITRGVADAGAKVPQTDVVGQSWLAMVQMECTRAEQQASTVLDLEPSAVSVEVMQQCRALVTTLQQMTYNSALSRIRSPCPGETRV